MSESFPQKTTPQSSRFFNLPQEIQEEIKSFLSFSEREKKRQVSKQFGDYLHDDIVTYLEGRTLDEVLRNTKAFNKNTRSKLFDAVINYAVKEYQKTDSVLKPEHFVDLLRSVARHGQDSHRDKIYHVVLEANEAWKSGFKPEHFVDVLSEIGEHGSDRQRDRICDLLNLPSAAECLRRPSGRNRVRTRPVTPSDGPLAELACRSEEPLTQVAMHSAVMTFNFFPQPGENVPVSELKTRLLSVIVGFGNSTHTMRAMRGLPQLEPLQQSAVMRASSQNPRRSHVPSH